MTHEYKIEGMTCGSCVSKVKSELLKMPDVLSAKVQLGEPQATIQMQQHISEKELQGALNKAGNYSITEINGGHHQPVDAEKSWFATYKPLLLIVAFILGVSLIAAASSESFGMAAMRYFMAGFFIVFSFFKFLDLKGFANSYAMYDLLAMRWKSYGYVYPFLELALGIAYLVNFEPFYTNLATIVVLGFSSIGVIKSVLDKSKIKCACLGSVFNLPMSTVTIVEDLAMVGMAILMIILN